MASIHKSPYPRVLFPLYERGIRRRKALACLRQDEGNPWRASQQVAGLQWHKLKPLLAYCRREISGVRPASCPVLHLRFHVVDEIPTGANGKFRVTLCELPDGDL